MRSWSENATTVESTRARAEGIGIRELRPTRRDSYGWEAEEEEKVTSKAESEQAKSLAFLLTASLAFRSLSLVLFVGETIPCQTASRDLSADDCKAFRVSQLANVVAKRLLIQIAEQVKRLNADVCAVELPFNETPEVLHRVCVNVPVRVLNCMIDDLMLEVRRQAIIGPKRVAKQRATGLHILAQVAMQFMLTARRNSEGTYLPAALNHSKRNGFILAARSGNDFRAARAMHISGLASDETLINFDFARQLGSIFILHGFADTVQQEPRRLLRHAEIAGHLTGTHTVLAVGDHPHGGKPFAQRDRRFVKDRTDFDRELFATFRRTALPDPASFKEHWLFGFAVRAGDAIRPTLARKVVQSVVGIVEVNNRFG